MHAMEVTWFLLLVLVGALARNESGVKGNSTGQGFLPFHRGYHRNKTIEDCVVSFRAKIHGPDGATCKDRSAFATCLRLAMALIPERSSDCDCSGVDIHVGTSAGSCPDHLAAALCNTMGVYGDRLTTAIAPITCRSPGSSEITTAKQQCLRNQLPAIASVHLLNCSITTQYLECILQKFGIDDTRLSGCDILGIGGDIRSILRSLGLICTVDLRAIIARVSASGHHVCEETTRPTATTTIGYQTTKTTIATFPTTKTMTSYPTTKTTIATYPTTETTMTSYPTTKTTIVTYPTTETTMTSYPTTKTTIATYPTTETTMTSYPTTKTTMTSYPTTETTMTSYPITETTTVGYATTATTTMENPTTGSTEITKTSTESKRDTEPGQEVTSVTEPTTKTDYNGNDGGTDINDNELSTMQTVSPYPFPDCMDLTPDACNECADGDYFVCFPYCQSGIYISCSNNAVFVRNCSTAFYGTRRSFAPMMMVFDPIYKRCERSTPYCPRYLDNEILVK